jgi:uncharacterized protein YhdP
LQVIGGKLAVLAPSLGVDAHIPKVHVRLRVDGDRSVPACAHGRDWMRPRSTRRSTSTARKGDGRAYAGAKQVDLAAWSALLKVQGITVESGLGRAAAWAELRGNRVATVTVDSALDAVALRGTSLDAAAAPQRRRFDHVEARGRYQLIKGGWRVMRPAAHRSRRQRAEA